MSRVKVKAIVKAEEVVIKGLPVAGLNFDEPYVTDLYGIEPVDYKMVVGDEISIGNQFRAFELTSIKDGKAVFKKFNDRGHQIDGFYLLNEKEYLFATSSGSARRGVVHIYHPPKNELEALFEEHKWSKNNIKTIPSLDGINAFEGGNLCPTADLDWYNFSFSTDGERRLVGDAEFHEGCGNTWMYSPNTYQVYGATYVAQVKKQRLGESFGIVWMTKEADMNQVIEAFKNILKYLDIK